MQQYIASLPNGLDSYPSCQLKSSVLRGFCASIDVERLCSALPETLAALVERPPPPSDWIDEVKTTAIFLASADSNVTGESFVAHAYRTNYALLDSTMYRILFRLVGARRVLANAGKSWSQFHRGTTLSVQSFDEHARRATVSLEGPAHHVPLLLAEGYATSIRAAVEISGHKDVHAAVEDHTPTRTLVSVRWS